MEVPETFHQYPLHIDAATNMISCASADPALQSELDGLNEMTRMIVELETPNQMVPPPAPVNPKRSTQITKLRENGNAEFKKGAHAEAVKQYDLAIKMAADRPPWEAAGLVREELAALHGNRAQALIAQMAWAEAAVDAEISLEMKKVGNTKGWFRRAQCLKEMGRKDEAIAILKGGLDFERPGPDKPGVAELEAQLKEMEG